MELKTKTLVNALSQIDFDKKAIDESSNLLLLNTIENKLSLNYTHHSLDTIINIVIDCEVASDINIAVDIQEFIKLVKTIKSDTIVLSIDYDNLKINNKLKINNLNEVISNSNTIIGIQSKSIKRSKFAKITMLMLGLATGILITK